MFSEKIHRYIFLFGVIALAFGMMMGTVPTSVPQMILMGNWLLELDFKRKWNDLKTNKIFWILSSVFVIHLLGLFYTQNLGAGWDDVRTKIPLMFLPLLFFSTKPLSKKEFDFVLYSFLFGSVTNTLWCLVYTHVLHNNEVVRNASRFMSHIRLGLFLNVAISCCVYFIYRSETLIKKISLLFLGLYFLFVMYALGLASGLINFVMLFFLFLIVLILRQKPVYKLISFIGLLLFMSGVFFYVHKVHDSQLKLRSGVQNTIQHFTPGGAPYIHFESNKQKENGNYIFINIQPDELERVWARTISEDSFSFKRKHNIIRYEVLIRYLSSKGLNKDSAAIASLSEEDKKNIRNNIFNYQYPSWSFMHRRVYEFVNEYQEFKDGHHINGHSVIMRMYFWKGAFHVIKNNFFTGVGTGDVQQAMNSAYQETSSPLREDWYKRPHNQFLTITVALGIGGLLLFIFSLFYPAFILRRELHILYWPFFIIALVSFLVEDTKRLRS